MKKLLFYLALLFSVAASAQLPVVPGFTNRNTKEQVIGSIAHDIQIPPADTTHSKVGIALRANVFYIGNGSWWTALGTGSGTVTNITSGYGLTGGPITTTGTLKVDTSFGGLTSWLLTKKKIDSLGALIGTGDLQFVTDKGSTTTHAITADQFISLPTAFGDVRAGLGYRTNSTWYEGVLSLWDQTGLNTAEISPIEDLGAPADLRVHQTNVGDRDTLANLADIRLGVGGTTPNLLQVTTIGNRADSVLFRNVSPFGFPATEFYYGSSIDAGQQASVADSSAANRTALQYGLTLTNHAAASRGTWQATKSMLADIQPGHTSLVITGGPFNDIRQNNIADRRTSQKIVNGLKSMFANQYLASYTQAGAVSANITKTGTWGAFNADAVGGKSSNGTYTQTLSDSITYRFTGQNTLVVALVAGDSINQAFAKFSIKLYEIGGSTIANAVYTENGQIDGVSDGSDNNQRGTMVIMYAGLAKNKTYKVQLASMQGTNTFAVDYFGHLVLPSSGMPMVWLHPSHMDATGYAASPANATTARMDTISGRMDSLRTMLLSQLGAYPLYIAPTNTYFNASTSSGLYSDHIHMTDEGFRQQTLAIYAVLPSLNSSTPGDGTVYYAGGHAYVVVNGVSIQLDNDAGSSISAGTGLTNTAGVLSADISTGIAGGQTIYGGTAASEDLTITSTAHATKRKIIWGSANYVFDESAGTLGLGVSAPTAQLDIVSNGTTRVLARIQAAASQSANLFHIINSASADLYKIDATGAIRKTPGSQTAATGPAGEEEFNDGSFYWHQHYNRNGSAYVASKYSFSTMDLAPGGTTNFRASTGGIYIGDATTATARLHIKAGTATAGTAPLKITAGTVLGTTEAGAIENDGTHLYYTAANAGTRFQLDQQVAGGGAMLYTDTAAMLANYLTAIIAVPTKVKYTDTAAMLSNYKDLMIANSALKANLASPTFTGTVALPIVTMSNKITNYNSINTVSNGVPSIVAEVNATTQAANIGSTTLYAVPADGFYRVSMYETVTQAATTSSTMPSVSIVYTDGNSGTNSHTLTGIATQSGNSVTTTFGQVMLPMYVKAGTNITYSTASYASSGGTPMQYALRIRLEAL